MSTTEKPLSFDDAALPATGEPTADVRVWQAKKIRAGLKDADEGRFATAEAVKETIQKFIPNG